MTTATAPPPMTTAGHWSLLPLLLLLGLLLIAYCSGLAWLLTARAHWCLRALAQTVRASEAARGQ